MPDETPFDAMPEEVPWERSSPGIFLSEAITAILELLDPHGPKKVLGASYTRVRWARISIIFSAFAAEGYINRALIARLGRKDFEAVDRLPTVEKYAIGTRVAFGTELFDRGRDPLQTLAELFEFRNATAHPKPKTETISRDEFLAGPDADIYTPTRAVRFVAGVAEAASILVEASGDPPDPMISLVLPMKAKLLSDAQAAEQLPRPTLNDYREAFARIEGGLGEGLTEG